MRKTGIADLPLHYGSCPKWLFERMKMLGKSISEIIIFEYGQDEFLKRLADPFFFQSFACVLGFDWHSSGATTTVCRALKDAINKENTGIVITGGKGKMLKKVQKEIEIFSDILSLNDKNIEKLKYASKMSAKIDNVAIQDGYNLYHHCFIFTEKCKWVTIQQGLNKENRYARRYHWLSSNVKNFVKEPHNAICCDRKEENVLNMVANDSEETRKISVDLVKDNIGKRLTKQTTLEEFSSIEEKKLIMPYNHKIKLSKIIIENLKKAYEIQPNNYEELIAIDGIGANCIRALALISQIIYGKEPSWKDPVKFSFAHGGKDGIPYPVDRKLYDSSIEILKDAIERAKINDRERVDVIRRLEFYMK